jgi:hypothetical protein
VGTAQLLIFSSNETLTNSRRSYERLEQVISCKWFVSVLEAVRMIPPRGAESPIPRRSRAAENGPAICQATDGRPLEARSLLFFRYTITLYACFPLSRRRNCPRADRHLSAALESSKLHPPLDRHTQTGKSFFKQAFGFGLRKHQPVGIGTLHVLHADAADYLATRGEVDRFGLEPGVDERLCSSAPVQQFKSPAPQDKSFRLVGSLCGLSTIRTGTP